MIISYVTKWNASCHTYKGVNTNKSDKSCQCIEWVISHGSQHIWIRHTTYSRRHVTWMNASCHTCKRVTSHIQTSHVTHMHESRHRSTGRTGWRWLIGSPKLQIIFHKRANKYRSLLPKMTYKDKGSYESSPPSIAIHTWPNSTHHYTYGITYSIYHRTYITLQYSWLHIHDFAQYLSLYTRDDTQYLSSYIVLYMW